MLSSRAALAIFVGTFAPACKRTSAVAPPIADDGGPRRAAVPAGKAGSGTDTGTLGRDAVGDPLPAGAVARLGSQRFFDRGLEKLVFATDSELVSSDVKGYTVWQAATGRLVATLEQRDPGPILAAAPGGKLIATAPSSGGKIQLWDLAGRKQLGVLDAGRPVDALCFADLDTLVSGSDGLVVAWRVSSGVEVARLPIASADLTALACAPGQAWWGDDGGAVWTVRLAGQAAPIKLGASGKRVTAIAATADGRRLAAGTDDGDIQVWSSCGPARGSAPADGCKIGPPITIQAHDRTIGSVAWSGDVLWSSGGDAWLRSRRPDGVLLKELEAVTGLSMQFLALSPDGKRAATWSLHRGAKGSEAGRMWLWSLATGEVAAEPERHTASLTSIAFAPDGKHVATGSEDRTVRVWDVPSGKPAAVLTTQEGAVNVVAFARDGTSIYSAGVDAYLHRWQWASHKDQKAIGPIGGEVNALAFAADERHVVTGDEVGRVWSWDLAARAKLQAHDRRLYASITAVALAPNRKTLAIGGSERFVLIVDLESGAEVTRLLPDVVSNFAAAFSPDGKLLATAGDDGRVRLWDTRTWRQSRALEGHDGTVRCVAFSADGGRLASGGSDGSARVWQVADGKEVAVFRGHTGAVTSVALSRDGGLLGTASQDRTALLWRLPSAR